MSATDALFTLNASSARRSVDTPSAGIGGSSPSAVTGVCFARDPATSHAASPTADSIGGVDGDRSDVLHISDDGNCSSDEESGDSDSEPLQFRCSDLLLGPQGRNAHINNDLRSYQNAAHLSAASHNFLSGAILASCHFDGSCKLWDLSTRRTVVDDVCRDDPRGGAGLALRRVGCGNDEGNRFLYQTRDRLGTVSFHDLERPCAPIVKLHTHSTSFCALSPCRVGAEGNATGGEANLVALPTEEHSVAVVRDLRCDPNGNPAWRVAVGGDYMDAMMYGSRRKYGMLTSLALCVQEPTRNIVLGCGMENGSALFYDLGAMRRGRDPWRVERNAHENEIIGSSEVIADDGSGYTCNVSLGKDPVLSLDLCSSSNGPSQNGEKNRNETTLENGSSCIQQQSGSRPSLVAVGGCAGDADDLSELPAEEQGTVSTIKVKLAENDSSDLSLKCAAMKATVRARTSTCSITSGGKIGVSICRFRPDGRIFAVGGWDHRLRLFGRTSSKPLAILRGHEESVTAMDWAGSSPSSGLLATGAGDGRICVWRVFPHSSRAAGDSGDKILGS